MNAHPADETGRRATVFPSVYGGAQAPEQAQQRGRGVLAPAMRWLPGLPWCTLKCTLQADLGILQHNFDYTQFSPSTLTLEPNPG